MSTNNGQKLLVFGLGFAQHDSRKMQQVLRHYHRLPSNPGSRAALFVELTRLGKELALDEGKQLQAQQVEDWMRHGGEFPLGITPAPTNAAEQRQFEGRTTHLPTGNNAFRPLQNHHRYGPGHSLQDPVDADDDVPGDGQPNDTNRETGNNTISFQQEREAEDIEPETEYSEQATEMEEYHEDGDSDQDMDEVSANEHQGTVVPGRAGFYGRGRTLTDAEGPAFATEGQDEVASSNPAPNRDVNNGLAVPQLRGNQQWRGSNVHGLQQRGMGMGMRFPHGMAPHHGHRPRPRRPRMEHDLEDEDEIDELDGWGAGRGPFALGPGRTLNDPVPGQDEGLNQHVTAEDPLPNDETHHSDSEPESVHFADRPGDDDAEPIECPICLEEHPPSGFPRRPTITELCDHPDKACLQCLDSSITSIVETGALHILACPICPQKLNRRDVKEYASRKIYERYKYLKQQALRPGHYISCTNSSCGGSQAHDCSGPNGPRMVCNFCQAETCARHRRPWHDGQTCLEFDMDPAQIERLEEEEATAKLLAKEATSICPKCGQGVTKTEGCDHMMCQCGTEWCYVVSTVYSSIIASFLRTNLSSSIKCSCSWENILRIGATAHATFCIYHPNKVSLTQTQQDAARARIMGLVHGGEVSAELTRARDEFRQRRREEMRPKLAEAAEARVKLEQQKRQNLASAGEAPPRKKSKVKLVPAWEEGGWTKKAL